MKTVLVNKAVKSIVCHMTWHHMAFSDEENLYVFCCGKIGVHSFFPLRLSAGSQHNLCAVR